MQCTASVLLAVQAPDPAAPHRTGPPHARAITVPVPTVLQCCMGIVHCPTPCRHASPVAYRPPINTNTSGGGVGNPSGAATSQPAPSTTTSTSQQPRYYRPPRITAGSNSNRTSGGGGDGLGGIVPPSLLVYFFVLIVTKKSLKLKSSI